MSRYAEKGGLGARKGRKLLKRELEIFHRSRSKIPGVMDLIMPGLIHFMPQEGVAATDSSLSLVSGMSIFSRCS